MNYDVYFTFFFSIVNKMLMTMMEGSQISHGAKLLCGLVNLIVGTLALVIFTVFYIQFYIIFLRIWIFF